MFVSAHNKTKHDARTFGKAYAQSNLRREVVLAPPRLIPLRSMRRGGVLTRTLCATRSVEWKA